MSFRIKQEIFPGVRHRHRVDDRRVSGSEPRRDRAGNRAGDRRSDARARRHQARDVDGQRRRGDDPGRALRRARSRKALPGHQAGSRPHPDVSGGCRRAAGRTTGVDARRYSSFNSTATPANGRCASWPSRSAIACCSIPEITRIDFEGARAYEIHAEVPEANLRAYGLTLDEIARRIRETALELPGGSVETRSGEILLRVHGAARLGPRIRKNSRRRDRRRVRSSRSVTSLTCATVSRRRTVIATYNGHRSIGPDRVSCRRADADRCLGCGARVDGKQSPATCRRASTTRSTATGRHIYRQRLALLLKNACIGLVLVLGLLGLFLELKLAFWVTMGIPTSFLGALLFLPAMDVSINMVSMFAFIVALGIVVDDAIVAGENIYEYRHARHEPSSTRRSGARATSRYRSASASSPTSSPSFPSTSCRASWARSGA